MTIKEEASAVSDSRLSWQQLVVFRACITFAGVDESSQQVLMRNDAANVKQEPLGRSSAGTPPPPPAYPPPMI